MRRVLAIAVLGLALTAPSAAAQSTGFIFFGDGGKVVEESQMTVDIRGSVAVDFGGDTAAGCEAAGTCGVSGTLTWSPPGRGTLGWARLRERGKDSLSALLAFGGPDANAAVVTQAFRTAPDGSTQGCFDATSGDFGLSWSGHGTTLDAGLGSSNEWRPDLFPTHCTAPLMADIAAALITRPVPLKFLRTGGGPIDLRSERRFAAGGFAGIVRSSVVVYARRPQRQSGGGGSGTRRAARMLSADYAIERVSGQVELSVAGHPERLICDPFDACGATGTTTITQTATKGTFSLFASAPASQSWKRLEASLGLRSGPRARNLDYAGGGGTWEGTGTAVATLSRPDGSICRDSVPVGEGVLSAEIEGDRLVMSYSPGFADALRTRCPGPRAGDAVDGVASGSVPLSSLRNRTTTVVLGEGRAVEGGGFVAPARSNLTVVLRRKGISRTTRR